MKENKKIVAALDIGSSKVLAVVAEVSKDGTFRVLGQGRSESQAIHEGCITNVEDALPSVNSALDEAFRIAGRPVSEVITNISGKYLVGVDSTASLPLKGRHPTLNEMQTVKAMAQDAVQKSDETFLIKSELLYYMLDNQRDEQSEQNLLEAKGSNISAHLHSAVSSALNASMRLKVIRRSGVEISSILPEAWASGYGALTEEERQNGVVLIDIGAGTTDIVVFKGGSPRFTHTIAYGGKKITERLAGYLHCSMKQAEEIKLRLDLNCLPEHKDVILYKAPLEEGGRKYSKYELSQIAAYEVLQLYNEIGRLLYKDGWYTLVSDAPKNRLPGGIVLTGGTAIMMGITELFSSVVPGPWRYTFSTRLGRSLYNGDACIGLNSPKETVVMGLIAYEAKRFSLGEDAEDTADTTDNSFLARAKRGMVEFFVGQY